MAERQLSVDQDFLQQPRASSRYYSSETYYSPCPKVGVEGWATSDHEALMEQTKILSPWAARFGYAGLIPQLVFLLMAVAGGPSKWIAQAGSFAYAALIFSFLGGLWWSQAIASKDAKPWQFGISVAPSLVGLACFMPWVWGWPWPEPYLAGLGLLLALSPLIDGRLSGAEVAPPGWHTLRLRLSIGLGLTTLAISMF